MVSKYTRIFLAKVNMKIPYISLWNLNYFNKKKMMKSIGNHTKNRTTNMGRLWKRNENTTNSATADYDD